jgi:hypothetical protein
MVKSYRQRSFLFLTATIGSFLVFTWSAQVQGQTGDWEREWQKIIQAAKKEGKLVFHSGNSTELYFHEFQKRFPEIKMTRMLHCTYGSWFEYQAGQFRGPRSS